MLVQSLIKSIGQRIELNPIELTNQGISLLAEHDWPGNIRELENFLERLMNESTSSVIPDSLVKKHIKRALDTVGIKREEREDPDSLLSLNQVEENYIKKTLDYYGRTLEGKKGSSTFSGDFYFNTLQ